MPHEWKNVRRRSAEKGSTQDDLVYFEDFDADEWGRPEEPMFEIQDHVLFVLDRALRRARVQDGT